jgi:hypothetical protein
MAGKEGFDQFDQIFPKKKALTAFFGFYPSRNGLGLFTLPIFFLGM